MEFQISAPPRARLHTKACALSFGIVGGLALGSLTLIAAFRKIPKAPGLLGELLPGYAISLGGSLAGLVYGFFIGAIVAGSFSWLYNRLLEGFLRLQSSGIPTHTASFPMPRRVEDGQRQGHDGRGVSPGLTGTSGGTKDEADPVEKASRLWGESARLKQDATAPIVSWTECPHVLKLYVNPTISGSAEDNWIIYVAKKYFPQPVPRALSIGSGDGCLERHALQLNVAGRFDAFDVSPEAIEIARAKACEFGCADRVTYHVANLNDYEFDSRTYDAAFASSALHHIVELEHLLGQIEQSLRPGSLFVVHEYVGPEQFQWTDVQLRLANELLLKIPERYRKNLSTGGLKTHVVRPTREEMRAGDPTEAIRSSQIVPLVAQKFEILERIDFGGTLLHLVLADIAGNFHSEPEDIAILQELFEFERMHIREGDISSDFTLIMARTRT